MTNFPFFSLHCVYITTGCSTLRRISEHDICFSGTNKYLCCLGLCGGLRLLLLLCCTCRSALRARRPLWSPRLSSSTRSLERRDILNLTLFYSPLTLTPEGRGVEGEEGLHIKQCVTLIMHLSMAAVMEASSHRKPSSARNSPIQLTLFHRTVLKCQSPAAQQTSHLLKILFDMWGNITFKHHQLNFEYFIPVFTTKNTFVYIPESLSIRTVA